MKFEANVARDARNINALQSAGWSVSVIWECETVDVVALRAKLLLFLGKDRATTTSATRHE